MGRSKDDGPVAYQASEREFGWLVYGWELRKVRGSRAEDAEAGVTTTVLVATGSGEEKDWYPMRDAPALYREAAAVNVEDAQAVLAWVNKRGILWDPEAWLPEFWNTPLNPDLEPFRLPFDETPDGAPLIELSVVQNELRALRDAVRTLDALRGRGTMPEVEYSPGREPGGEPVVVSVGELHVTGSAASWAWKLAKGSRTRELYFLAWAAFWYTLAHKLSRGLDTTITWGPRVQQRILRKANVRGVLPVPDFRLQFLPSSLASCMWWQLYRDAVAGREYRQCTSCETWFLPRRTDQEVCSRRCYMRQYMRAERGSRGEKKRRKGGGAGNRATVSAER